MSDPSTTTNTPGDAGTTGDPSVEAFGYRQELKRSLTFTDLLVYGLVFMVPIAPFGIFGGVFQASGGMVALAYAIGGLAMAFTAASYSQMSRAFPMAGSVYTYAGRGIAQPVGFIAGWMILLDYVLVPGLLYLIASIAMNSIITSVPVWIWLVAFVVLIPVIGFEIPAALLAFVWLRFLGQESWRSSIVTTLAVVVAFYLIFVAALAVPIPHLF